MPATALDPVTALVVVDLQEGITSLPLAHPVPDVVAATTALLAAFRAHHLPVVLVNVAGSPPGRTDRGPGTPRAVPAGWSDLIDDLDQQPGDLIVTKRARSAFSGTGLTGRLRDLGVTQVVVVGIATASGVESTARSAHEDGFNVTLPTDAMTDRTLASHQHAVTDVFPRIAETAITADVLRLLDGRRR